MIGLIPAGGSGQRWGGYIKELLPIGETFLLNNTISELVRAGCDRICIVSTPEKFGTIARHLAIHPSPVPIAFAMGGTTMWGSLLSGMEHFQNEDIFMLMPDTITSISKYRIAPGGISFGLFKTSSPERFSVFVNGGMVTKDQSLAGQEMWAWGAVHWSPAVTFFFLNNTFPDYDAAFTAALSEFRWVTFDLPFYYDMASWRHYAEYIKGYTDVS